MNKEILTPEESLSLITRTIQEAKNRFVENGYIFIVWGVLLSVASLGQFILLQLEYYEINYYPYFLMPLGGIYTYIYYRNKRAKKELPKTVIGNVLQTLGIILGANFLVLGFIYWKQLGSNLFPIFFIFLALWVIITGTSIKYKPLIIFGLLLNLIGFAIFFIEKAYHPAIMSIASIITLVIPGIILNRTKAKENV